MVWNHKKEGVPYVDEMTKILDTYYNSDIPRASNHKWLKEIEQYGKFTCDRHDEHLSGVEWRVSGRKV